MEKRNRKEKKKYQKKRINKLKIGFINEMGGKCMDCEKEYDGENGSIFIFAPKHEDGKRNVAIIIRCESYKSVKEKIDGCSLICRNCWHIRKNGEF